MKIKYYLVFLIILLFTVGCEKVTEQPIEEEKGSGILFVKSVPADGDVFLDNTIKGKTPLTLYGLPVGSYNVLIKKEGYENYRTAVEIRAGKKEEIGVILREIKKEVVDDGGGEISEEIEEDVFVGVPEENIIELGDKILKYYDFSEKEFTDKLKRGSDVFSKRYSTHLVFTRYSNVNVDVIDKNINEIEREDCVNILGTLGLLNSGQTLCVKTKEGNIVAIGGSWEDTADGTLIWRSLD